MVFVKVACGITHDFLSWQVPEWCLDYWHPSEKAMYPDYFSKREQWKKLRMESWDREVRLLTGHGSLVIGQHVDGVASVAEVHIPTTTVTLAF